MSAIEWTDKTWNPATGCTKISQGCKEGSVALSRPRIFFKMYFESSGFQDVGGVLFG